MRATDTHRAIEAVWRIESARLIAGLTRIVRDVGVAEELAQDALVAALEQWPESGIPENPGAWLMATAKHRAIDHFRRDALIDRKHEDLGRELAERGRCSTGFHSAALDDSIGDDLLRLVFIACHPVLSTEARVALTLRLLGGLTTDEIARAFLVAEPTIAQRIVRAKRTLAEARVPFEVPRGAEFTARLSSVLQVIYLVFNEGYSATAGDDWMRPCALRGGSAAWTHSGRIGADEPEVHGLVALMEIQASRSRARVDASGEPVLAARSGPRAVGSTSDPPRTCRTRSRRAARREARTVCHPGGDRGLSRASPHVQRRPTGTRIVALYGDLAEVGPSPVVELNRAVAVGMAFGPAAGLELVDRLHDDPTLRATTCCPAFEAICSRNSAVPKKLAGSSREQHP